MFIQLITSITKRDIINTLIGASLSALVTMFPRRLLTGLLVPPRTASSGLVDEWVHRFVAYLLPGLLAVVVLATVDTWRSSVDFKTDSARTGIWMPETLTFGTAVSLREFLGSFQGSDGFCKACFSCLRRTSSRLGVWYHTTSRASLASRTEI